MTHQEIIDFLDSVKPEPIMLEPRSHFDAAVVNFRSVFVSTAELIVAVYNTDHVIDILMDVEGISRTDAVEWFFSNIGIAYFGPSTPIFIQGTTDGQHSQPSPMGSH